MNLITDAWIPVIRASGPDKIAPWQIAERNNPVMELNAPRRDFQGALYQFLIGLLQTCFAPEDHDKWLEYWESIPDSSELRDRLTGVSSAFVLKPNSPLPALISSFMQDSNIPDGNANPISLLLIDAPGDKTIRDNQDHFVKRGAVNGMCHTCAAMALFTLQINAPSGGNGHRVSLRGGGPLTTLVMPTVETPLWNKLWLNVLDAECFTKSVKQPMHEVFPWFGRLRVSFQEKVSDVKYYINGGLATTPEDAHDLQHYWSMPRRIRALFNENTLGTCDLCNSTNVELVREYVTDTWGVDYVVGWIHPLTPYWFDPKKEKPPLSIKGQRGGLGYRHWIGFVLANSVSGNRAAKIAEVYMEQRALDIGGQRHARLWCFGYDMDNMKARCWYEDTLPLFQLDSVQRENVFAWASDLLNAADEVATNLQTQVKAAWFSRPKDAKGNMGAITHEFWQQSENSFYKLLNQIAELPATQRQAPAEIYKEWGSKIQAIAYRLFDEWAMEAPAEDLDMKRVIAARQELSKKLASGKAIKEVFAKAGIKAKKEKGVNNAARTSLPLS